jgi:hypothetical protein
MTDYYQNFIKIVEKITDLPYDISKIIISCMDTEIRIIARQLKIMLFGHYSCFKLTQQMVHECYKFGLMDVIEFIDVFCPKNNDIY